MMMSRTLFFALLATPGAIASTAGKMTMWSDDPDIIVGSSCEYANSAQGGLNSPAATSPYITSRSYCAVSNDLSESGLACGRCYRVTFDGTDTTETTGCNRAGSAIIQVVDSGSAKEFDCQDTVFEEITGCNTGVMGISYEEVECEAANGQTHQPRATVVYGDSAWWTKVHFSDLPRAVSAASIMVEGQSQPLSMTRSGGTWYTSTSEGISGNVHVTFTVTLDNTDTVVLTNCFSSWPQSTGAWCTPPQATGDDENAPPGDDENALPGDDENALPGGDENALPGGDENAALPGGDENAALPGGDENALPGDNENALPGDNENAQPAANCAAHWEQCGGVSFGDLCCEAGLQCYASSQWYSQCLAGF